jgi:DNA-binding GntR family transcriptional regulator
MKGPRYQQLASTLIDEIRAGRWQVGDLLPTELDLCERFGVSRHTAREALRQLREAGMIERRQGSGTRLAAVAPRVPYQQRASSIEDLLQYGKATRLTIASVEQVPADARIAEWLGLSRGEPVLHLHGQRRDRSTQTLLCVTDIYLRAAAAAVRRYGDTPALALATMLTDLNVARLSRVEQRFAAVPMPKAAAAELGTRPGTPALAALRHYFGRDGALILVANSIHPGNTFTLSMSLGHDAMSTR